MLNERGQWNEAPYIELPGHEIAIIPCREGPRRMVAGLPDASGRPNIPCPRYQRRKKLKVLQLRQGTERPGVARSEEDLC